MATTRVLHAFAVAVAAGCLILAPVPGWAQSNLPSLPKAPGAEAPPPPPPPPPPVVSAPPPAAPSPPPAASAPALPVQAAPAPARLPPLGPVGESVDMVLERPVADVYAPELRGNEAYVLADPVRPLASPAPLGLWNQTLIQSRYGNLAEPNESFAKIRMREIEAIAKLKAIDTGETVVGGIGNAAAAPFRAVGALLTSPVETIGNIPKGVGDMLARTGEGFSSDKSKFEDSAFEEIAGVSAKKREIAAQMGVDVYSGNPLLQSELDRIGAASAGGNVSVKAGSLAITGPAGAVVGSLGGVDTLQNAVNTLPAAELRRRTRYTLEQMAMPKSFIDQFLDHPYYSPRRKTIIAGLLSPLKETKGREKFMEAALTADSEAGALYYQQMIEMISGFNFTVAPVGRIVLVGGFPVAVSDQAGAFLAVPADRIYWTAEAARFTDKLLADLPKAIAAATAGSGVAPGAAKAITLWALGDFTPLAADELGKRGIRAARNAPVNYN